MAKKSFNEYTLMASLENVGRWGTLPKIRRVSVAEHTFSVLFTVRWLIRNYEPGTPLEDIVGTYEYAMEHDAMEGATGDPPSPVKRLGWIEDHSERMVPKLFPVRLTKPSPETKEMVKVADRLVMLREAMAERDMGNQLFKSLVVKCYNLAVEKLHPWLKRVGSGQTPEKVVILYLADCPPLIGVSHIIETALEN